MTADAGAAGAQATTGNGFFGQAETHDQICLRLGRMNELDYGRIRNDEAAHLGVKRPQLDKMRKEGVDKLDEMEDLTRERESKDKASQPDNDDDGYISRGRFAMKEGRGLFYATDERSVFVCGPFRIIAETRDGDSQSWGLRIEYFDHDGKRHIDNVPKEDLAGDGSATARRLLRGGLDFGSDRLSQPAFLEYFHGTRTTRRVTLAYKCGWHHDDISPVYVMPDATIGNGHSDDVNLQSDGPVSSGYVVKGTLEEWRDNIAALGKGNSRMIFAISTAFAGPLMEPAGEESGGINLEGASKIGKTTLMMAGVSVWGGRRHLLTWRATSNGLESVAASHNDNALFLDELGQIETKDAGQVVYMLANGAGKTRMRKDGAVKPPLTWRLLFLSSGEVGIGARLAEIGQKAKAGQEVRLVGVPADAAAGHGAFEDLHGCASADELANKIRKATALYYGTAGVAFVRRLVADRCNAPDKLSDKLKDARAKFFALHKLTGKQGQVASVASRFAVIAAAGELATAYELTGWEPGDAIAEVSKCFKAWLAGRGSDDANLETLAHVSQVRAFIGQHGDSRFQRLGRDADENGDNAEPETGDGSPSDRRGVRVMLNRVGFRKKASETEYHYIVLPELWASEVCRGLDPTATAKTIKGAGFLVTDGGGSHLTRKERGLPGLGRPRCYVVSSRIMDAPDDPPATQQAGGGNG